MPNFVAQLIWDDQAPGQGGFWFWGWRWSQIRIGSAWIGISNSKKGKAKMIPRILSKKPCFGHNKPCQPLTGISIDSIEEPGLASIERLKQSKRRVEWVPPFQTCSLCWATFRLWNLCCWLPLEDFYLDEPNLRFVYRFLDFNFNLKKVAKGESHQRSLWYGSGLAELSGSQGLAFRLDHLIGGVNQRLNPWFQ